MTHSHGKSLRTMVAALALTGAACSSSNKAGGTGGAAGAGFGTGGQTTTGNGGAAQGGMTGTGNGGTGGGGASGGTTGAAGGSTGGGAGGMTGVGGLTGAGNACMTGTPTGTAPNTLAVNVDTASITISKEIYGVLMERNIGRGITGGLFVGTTSTIPNTNGMRNDIIQGFKDAGVGMIEWPGGCNANNYNYLPTNPANDMGTDRYMQLSSILGIDPYIAGGGTAALAARNLAWITYINNNATHPEWNLKYFKVGNEVWGCGGNQTEAMYEPNYAANFAMLSPAINGKKTALIAGTDLVGRTAWLSTQLMNQASMIDGIELHDYIYHPTDIPSVGFTDAQYYNIVNSANRGQIGPRLTTYIGILDQFDPQKRIKIWEDEWGDWLQPLNATDGFFQQMSLMDAISSAEQLHLFMQHADRVFMAGAAQAVNVIHALFFTHAADAALVKTPAFYIFKMFIPHHSNGAKWAPNTLTSENITGNGQTFPVLSAGTSVDASGNVNISLANVDLVNTRTIQINLTSAKAGYNVALAQVITGPAKDSVNDFTQTETVNIQTLPASSCTAAGKSLRVTLPSKSVAMLVLTPQ